MAKILLIDDEPSIRTYFERLLTGLRYEVQTASDSPTGLACAERTRFDLIISDLNMPGTPSGLDLIKMLREKHPGCPVVVISGYPTRERLDACREMGVVDFLTKPFEMPFIVSVLSRLLPPESKTKDAATK